MNSRADYSLLSLNQVRAMLGARMGLIVRTIVATLVATLALVMVLPRVWTASADVFIDYRENDPINGRTFSALLDESYMQTQIDMIQSQAVADKMITTLGLLPKTGSAAKDTVAHNDLITYIGRNLEVTNARNSRVLTVSFSAETPEKAQQFANAIVNAYIAVSQNISSSAARARTEQYTAQLDQLRDEMNATQDKLTRYQQETGIVDTHQGDDIETRRLADMTASMLALEAQLAEARARSQTLDTMLKSGMRPEDVPQVGQVPAINDLRQSLAIVNRQLAELQGTLGPNHPSVRGLAAQRHELETTIARQAGAVLDTQRKDTTRLQAQKAALQEAIDTQRRKVLDLMAKRDRIAAYQRQFAGIEQVYNTALQKFDGLLMASNITLPNLAVLRAAETPTTPSRPRVRRSLALGLLVGIMGGLGLALLLELRRRRVRCADDLLRDANLPLIGVIGRPQALTSATL